MTVDEANAVILHAQSVLCGDMTSLAFCVRYSAEDVERAWRAATMDSAMRSVVFMMRGWVGGCAHPNWDKAGYQPCSLCCCEFRGLYPKFSRDDLVRLAADNG